MKKIIGLLLLIFTITANAELVVPKKYFNPESGCTIKQTAQRFSQENPFVVEITCGDKLGRSEGNWYTKCGYETNSSTGFEEIICDTKQKNLLILTHGNFAKSIIFMDAHNGINNFKTKVNIKIDGGNSITDLSADLIGDNHTDIVLRKLKSGTELIYTWKRSNEQFEKNKINLIGLKQSLEFVDALKIENKSY